MALMSRLAMELRTTSGRDHHKMLRTTLVQWHLDKGFTSGQIFLFDHCFLRPANCILLSMRLKRKWTSSLLKGNLTLRALLIVFNGAECWQYEFWIHDTPTSRRFRYLIIGWLGCRSSRKLLIPGPRCGITLLGYKKCPYVQGSIWYGL